MQKQANQYWYTPRPVGTFGFTQGDQPFLFEFNIGNSF